MSQAMEVDTLAVGFKNLFPIDVLIKQFKYQGELVLSHPIADLFPAPPVGALSQELKKNLVLVPVPASSSRIQSRGFDHLHLLARHYSKRFQLKIHPASRKQEARAQAKLGRRDRKRNLLETFEIHPPGKAVLLMDDVMTTGATLSALAERCRDQGAEWVGAVVLARTLGPSELYTQS